MSDKIRVFLNGQCLGNICSIEFGPKPYKKEVGIKKIKCKFADNLYDSNLYENYNHEYVEFDGINNKFEFNDKSPLDNLLKKNETEFELKKKYSWKKIKENITSDDTLKIIVSSFLDKSKDTENSDDAR